MSRELSALSLTLGAQDLGEEVGHVGRLELIRRQVHDAAATGATGPPTPRSPRPSGVTAITLGRPGNRPWLTTIASSSAASPCAARKAAAGPAALAVATSSTAPVLSAVRPSRSSGSTT